MTREYYDIGEQPPLGEVPPKMHAWLTRAERFGEPMEAWKTEIIDVPEIADDEVLVYVMAAGVNYNNVWAGLGVPINVIAARNKAGEPEEFHIGGSDASGIVYKIGKDVTHLKVGDEVVVHCGTWDRDCDWVKAGEDPMYSPSFRIWGYETNWGSFAQFTKVQAQQCLPKPKHLTWEDAAAYMLVGATAYRMLMGWEERSLRPEDVVLIWGGAGGLGSMAIQIARAKGAIPIAVVSSEKKFEYCEQLGAKGCINRKEFSHWGMLPHWKDRVGYSEWLKGVRTFGRAIWDVLGEKKNPRIVFEHPGETTIPTSMFVCDTGGMVVICAGTTGYNATVDLRYLWMRQKRLQGSHFANGAQSAEFNELVLEGKIDPCMSRAFTYEELPVAHQLMYDNKHPEGNMSVLIGAPEFGLGISGTVEGQAKPARLDISEPEEETIHIPHYEPESLDNIRIFDNNRTVRVLMSPGVISAQKSASVTELAHMLSKNNIRALVINDEGGYAVGVVSLTDIILARQGRRNQELDALTAEQIMTPNLVGCSPDTKVTEAVTLMTSRGIHRLVVLEQDETSKPKAIGVISMTDVLNEIISETPEPHW
ncbi:MAG: crotonyl-CoA carboxylase/reductase [Deltaproteobacteria bacterium]|nr:MAG: crotonyl-CoA carboxylase/reductase [Deltaproteobacteria bacterium]